jgi:hypothetical protein
MTHPARHILPLVLGLLLPLFQAGCDRPGPIELRDGVAGAPTLELLNEAPSSALLGTRDIDSSGMIQADPRAVFGEMMITGSVYDGLYLHREASLARAVFFDRSSPVLNTRGDTIGYHAVDAGTITIDGQELRKRDKRVALHDAPGDTLVGVQYVLKSSSGGIEYTGGHAYQWRNPVTAFPSPIETALESPAAIRVTSPLPSEAVSLARNLRVTWDGGGATVRIVISDPVTMEPIVKMRLRSNHGWAVIPRSILRLLPEGPGFVFTFSSERSAMMRADGFADDIRVRATTSHSLYYQCTR